MLNPISPQFVYLIHKEKERELLQQIEHERIAKERGSYEEIGAFEQVRTWVANTSLWMKEKFSNPASVRTRSSSQQEPCPGVPC